MYLTSFRRARHAAPTALVTLITFFSTLLPPRTSRADTAASDLAGVGLGSAGMSPAAGALPSADGVDAQASVNPSTGSAQASYQFELPRGPGDSRPSLSLTYDSSAGVGFAGVGWTLNLPSIVRKGSAGVPAFADPVLSSSTLAMLKDGIEDDYYVDGQLLIPVEASPLTDLPSRIPATSDFVSTNLWVMFRTQVDDGARYFFNGGTWVKQPKSGHMLVFGYPLDAPNGTTSPFATPGVEMADLTTAGTISNAAKPNLGDAIYRWNLVRDADAVGNTVYYVWETDGQFASTAFNGTNFVGVSPSTFGRAHLTDIYDTTSQAPSVSLSSSRPALGSFAHHTHLTWSPSHPESAQEIPSGYPSGFSPNMTLLDGTFLGPIWRAQPYTKLTTVDVASATWSGVTGPRQLVRRYQLGYALNDQVTQNYLVSIQPIGDCSATPISENASGVIGTDSTTLSAIAACVKAEARPATTYSYSRISGSPPTGSTLVPVPNPTSAAGFTSPAAPDFLADINGDSIADLVAGTNGLDPSTYQCLNCWLDTGGTILALGTFGVSALIDPNSVVACNNTGQNCFFNGSIQGPNQAVTSQPYPLSHANGLTTVQVNDGMWNYALGGTWGRTDRPQFMQLWPGTYVSPQTYTKNGNIQYTALQLFTGDTSASSSSVTVTDVHSSTSINTAYLSYADNSFLENLVGVKGNGGPPTGIAMGAFAPTQAVDVDGDGLPDMAGIWFTEPSNSVDRVAYFSTVDHFGLSHPFSQAGPHYCPSPSYDPSEKGVLPAYADMDGDGLADRVLLFKGTTNDRAGHSTVINLEWFQNRGDGRFGIPNSLDAFDAGLSCWAAYGVGNANSGSAAYGSSQGTGAFADEPITHAAVRLGDLNGDGLSDLAVLDSAGLHICLRYGLYGGTGSQPSFECTLDTSVKGNDQTDPSIAHPTIMIGDTRGAGTNQVVFFPAAASPFGAPSGNATIKTVYGGTSGAPRVGLLTGISNGLGATTTLTYDTVANQSLGSVPVPVVFVTGLTQTNGLTNNQQTTRQLTYSYAGPLYDARDKVFVGFRSVTVHNVGNLFSAGTVTKTTFDTTVCDPSIVPVGGTPSASSCTRNVDYGFMRWSRGRPSVVEVSDDGIVPRKLTTTLIANNPNYSFSAATMPTTSSAIGEPSAFAVQAPYTGKDGRVGVNALEVGTHTYTWDVSQVAQNTAWTAGFASITVATPKSGPNVTTKDFYDLNGNDIDTIDFGITGVDASVMTKRTWTAQGADTNSWLFRVTKSQRGFSTDDTNLTFTGTIDFETDTTYDSNGLPQVSYTPSVTGGIYPLPGPTGGRAAPQPSQANGKETLSVTAFDPNGNLIQTGSMLNPCAVTIAYDQTFHDLPESKTLHPDGSSSNGACTTTDLLTTGLEFDRGLQKLTGTLSPAGEIALTSYDDFGRVLEIDQPSVFVLGGTTPALKVVGAYQDTNPIQSVHYQTADGAETGTGPSYFVDHYQYWDAFGEVRAAVDSTGAVSSSGPTSWVVSGVHVNSTGGRVYSTFQPIPLSGTPSAIPSGSLPSVVTTPTGPFEIFAYDGMGRTVAVQDFRGNTTTYQYDATSVANPSGFCSTATSLTGFLTCVTDPEQSTGGGHVGAHTVEVTDGHGRLAVKDVFLNGGATAGAAPDPRHAGHAVTTYSYAHASSQATTISQTAGGITVPRTMTYDSLGRLVQTQELNTGTWTYAYDYDNRLVGTSDPRGCGENLFYDPIGRLVAEDYSRCTASQPAYSGLTTGSNGLPLPSGTEAYYQYDSAGRLALMEDRAQLTEVSYDKRSRASGMFRFPADLTGDPDPTKRYSNIAYQRTFTYDAAQRPLTATTGADLTSLLFNGQSAETKTYTYDGRLYSMIGSYGTVISSHAVTFSSSSSPNPGTLVSTTQYGDAAATTAQFTYYGDNSLAGGHIFRATAGPWTVASGMKVSPAAPDNSTLEGDLTNYALARDGVGNPIGIVDISIGAWPVGAAKEGTQTFGYYDDYRLAIANYNVGAAGDLWTSPYDYESKNNVTTYPLPSQPGTFTRVQWQKMAYDWRGNATSSTDDANDFVDRSLGTATISGTGLGPDQLQSTTEGGKILRVGYDSATAGGNIGQIAVYPGANLPATTTYNYFWDELGHLAEAKRIDGSTTSADDTFLYDANGKLARIASLGGKNTVTVFDSLVLKDVPFSTTTNSFDTSQKDRNGFAAERLYLGDGLAEVFYDASGVLPKLCPSSGTGACNALHMFLNIPDKLGSSAFVIDSGTGEIVERTTHQAYGTLDADFRPTRWHSFREDFKFTGARDVSEVGLTYMGARYYSPLVGRFISPDPVTMHTTNGDPNPYAYALGSPLALTDRTGLSPVVTCDEVGCAADDPDLAKVDPSTGQINLGDVFLSVVPPPPPPSSLADTSDQMWPTFDESGNPFAYSPGNDTTLTPVLTPKEQQEQDLDAFTFLGSMVLDVAAMLDRAVVTPFSRGNKFEAEGLDIIGATKNTQEFTVPVSGKPIPTIPDALESKMLGDSVTEFKDWQHLYNTPQLRAQQNLALGLGKPYNLIVGPSNRTISEPLWNGVRATGGNIYFLDPTPISIEGD